jgi:hypothetical protein
VGPAVVGGSLDLLSFGRRHMILYISRGSEHIGTCICAYPMRNGVIWDYVRYCRGSAPTEYWTILITFGGV